MVYNRKLLLHNCITSYDFYFEPCKNCKITRVLVTGLRGVLGFSVTGRIENQISNSKLPRYNYLFTQDARLNSTFSNWNFLPSNPIYRRGAWVIQVPASNQNPEVWRSHVFVLSYKIYSLGCSLNIFLSSCKIQVVIFMFEILHIYIHSVHAWYFHFSF
jgi:hypothetical protein